MLETNGISAREVGIVHSRGYTSKMILQMEHVTLRVEVGEKIKDHHVGQCGIVSRERPAEGKLSPGAWGTQREEQEREGLEENWKQTG